MWYVYLGLWLAWHIQCTHNRSNQLCFLTVKGNNTLICIMTNPNNFKCKTCSIWYGAHSMFLQSRCQTSMIAVLSLFFILSCLRREEPSWFFIHWGSSKTPLDCRQPGGEFSPRHNLEATWRPWSWKAKQREDRGSRAKEGGVGRRLSVFVLRSFHFPKR